MIRNRTYLNYLDLLEMKELGKAGGYKKCIHYFGKESFMEGQERNVDNIMSDLQKSDL
jgi:hypothetical protein